VGWVDVRDVAKAHINAMEMSEAQGRYLITSGVVSHLNIARMLKQLCPDAPVCVDEVSVIA
jgi:nucleoside-diphosphate-sugar epimerase